jgi:hypothetical protein
MFGGPEKASLRKLAEELGLGDGVVFAGRVSHQEIRRYYDLTDLLVFPRLSMRLTELVTPLKPLEAMAQERIVVASNVGGHRELIRDRDTGYLFPPDQPQHLIEGVLSALQDRASWPRIRARAVEYIETERSWAHSVDRYAEVDANPDQGGHSAHGREGVFPGYKKAATQEMARPRWQPTTKEREQVSMMTAIGIAQPAICQVLKVSEKTLRRACHVEIATGQTQANTQVGGALFQAAVGGNVAAMIFWMKTRAGWKETITIEQSKSVAEMTDLELNRVLLANGLDPIDLTIGEEPTVVPFPRRGRG